jgi:iron-sulfur cluster assembly protein
MSAGRQGLAMTKAGLRAAVAGQGKQPWSPDTDQSEVLTVLTLTDRAAETIRVLTSQPGIPAETGLRMSLQGSDGGSLTLSLEPPQPGDTVIEDAGAKVFVQEDVAGMVGDGELDAELDDQGQASFTLGTQNGSANGNGAHNN